MKNGCFGKPELGFAWFWAMVVTSRDKDDYLEQKTSLVYLQVSLILPFLCFRAQIRGEEDVLVGKPGRNVAIWGGKLASGVEEEVWITRTCLEALISRCVHFDGGMPRFTYGIGFGMKNIVNCVFFFSFFFFFQLFLLFSDF